MRPLKIEDKHKGRLQVLITYLFKEYEFRAVSHSHIILYPEKIINTTSLNDYTYTWLEMCLIHIPRRLYTIGKAQGIFDKEWIRKINNTLFLTIASNSTNHIVDILYDEFEKLDLKSM